MNALDITSDDLKHLTGPAELMERRWAPCRYHCPVHADVRAYIELVARGQWQAAIDVIRERLPMASVCGRVCHHPCEANCRREDVDEAVAIREVKRFVSEKQGAAGATVHKAVQDKARVAVVGGGPAGLAAALDLARCGYRPTVFEKFPVAGGIPATAIPRYRLPRDVLQQDVDWICAHGVELRTGVEIGKDTSVADLKADGFLAVIIATGLAKSRMLPLPGADHDRVYPVLEFLTGACFDEPKPIGRNVLVIGGGNVAMDAARTAVRLGARRVRAMCLENEEEMPAWSWEREEAEDEGVTFIHRRGPVEIVAENGTISGVSARKVTRVFDENDRFAPKYDDRDVVTVECDTVILAIGQVADMGFVAGSGLDVDDRRRLVYHPATQQTNDPAVFACGEIVTAPGSVVEACASGQRAAKAAMQFLEGQAIAIDDSLPEAIGEIAEATAEKVIKAPRNPVVQRSGGERIKDSAAIDANYVMDVAAREARRCMSCGGGAEVLIDKCAACLTCLRVCPFDIPVVTDVARIDSALCQACGICIAECPANAIISLSWDREAEIAETAERLATPAKRKIVAYISGYHASATAWNGDSEDAIAGVAEIYLQSVSRLGTAEMLRAMENGTDGIIVVACDPGGDRYPNAAERVVRRVDQLREMLSEIGLNPEKIQLVHTAAQGREAMRASILEAAEKIATA
jgi:NADPH-dependent glutamate synthase beta subunit-like oxidoreductase/coenzyme F420-reducing hydrogenase delta subunit/ferredoxin